MRNSIMSVKKIKPGMTIFLFNDTIRVLTGCFQAVSLGKGGINSTLFAPAGQAYTRYTSQVILLVFVLNFLLCLCLC